jgi:hypothetical protein
VSELSVTPASALILSSRLLRNALRADGILSAITGLAFAAANSGLGMLFGLPSGLLFWSGALLVPYALLVAWLGTRMRIYRPLVFVVIGLNLLWALDSVGLLLSRRVAPTPLGSVFTLGQALIVALVAQLEFVGLRRSTRML